MELLSRKRSTSITTHYFLGVRHKSCDLGNGFLGVAFGGFELVSEPLSAFGVKHEIVRNARGCRNYAIKDTQNFLPVQGVGIDDCGGS